MKKLFVLAAMSMLFTLITSAQDADSLYAKELLAPKTQAPDFKLKSPDNKYYSLEKLKGGGFIVLDFWASWCGDCRKDIPAMKELYEKYGKDVKFIGISFDEKKESWTSCIKNNDMKWLQLSELKKWKETEVSKRYNIKWIPTMYLLAPSGDVVLATTSVEKLGAKLEELGDTLVVEMPEFTGGKDVLDKFLSVNIKYPEEAAYYGFNGRVIIEFVVGRDGTISHAQVYKSVLSTPRTKKYEKLNASDKAAVRHKCQRLFNESALDVVSKMPKWQPGTIGGKPIRVKYKMPVTFRL